MDNKLESLLKLSKSIMHIDNINALLDQLLYETRRECRADAGSIYLVEGEGLRFSYVQNHTLSLNKPESRKHLYIDHVIPIDTSSIAGYVASTEEILNIEDVYTLSPDLSYHYNSSFDQQTGYRTRSILCAPLKNHNGDLIGVIQLINKENEAVFDSEDQDYIRHVSEIAAGAIERTNINQEVFMRLLRVAELRDPKETGAHVKRVGAYSVELYDAWARRHGIPDHEIRAIKDPLHTAAMLHDIGKVGIADKILKKPGKLDEDEYEVMKTHATIGAALFEGSTIALDQMSHDIIQGHHERWDGMGYPDRLKGEEIPLTARIVSLVDVFDALSSKRVYKDPWGEQDVLNYLKEQAGVQFDPELVELFIANQGTMKEILNRYQG